MSVVELNKFLCTLIVIDTCAPEEKTNILGKLVSIGEKEWRDLLVQARAYNCAPALFYILKKHRNSLKIPSKIYDKLQREYLKASASYLKRTHQVRELIKSFDGNRIDFLFLKGVIYSEYLYKNPAIRTMTDIDILVKKGDISKCFNLLLHLGYKDPYKKINGKDVEIISQHHLPSFDCDGKYSIELHSCLNLEARKNNYRSFDTDSLFKNDTEKFLLHGHDCLKLKDEYIFVYSSISLASQLFRQKLLRFYDLYLLIIEKKIDLEKVMSIAIMLDAIKIVKTVLFVLKEYFYCPNIPDSILSDFITDKKLKLSLEEFIFGGIHNREIDNKVNIKEVTSNHGVYERVKFILSKFFRYEDIFLVYGNISVKVLYYVLIRTYLGLVRLIKCGVIFIKDRYLFKKTNSEFCEKSLFGEWLKDL